jgi:hypothetical protein
MVDTSLVVNLAELVVLIVGVVIAIQQLGDIKKTREMELETRQAQLYMSLLDRWNTKEFSEQRYQAYRMQFTDLEDFDEKYNPSNNPESFASWNTFGRSIGGLAELKKKGLIDIAFLDGMMMSDVMNWWIRFGALEKEAWEKGSPNWWSHFPFIMEVVEYSRTQFPQSFDENGASKVAQSRGRKWVNPEEMMKLRAFILDEE